MNDTTEGATAPTSGLTEKPAGIIEPQFLLLEPHYIGNVIVPADTIVGAETRYPVEQPSLRMVGHNDAGKKAVEAYRNKRKEAIRKLPPNISKD